MKKAIKFLTKNWISKLVSLIIAVVVWFLINEQLGYNSRFVRDAMQNETWTD